MDKIANPQRHHALAPRLSRIVRVNLIEVYLIDFYVLKMFFSFYIYLRPICSKHYCLASRQCPHERHVHGNARCQDGGTCLPAPSKLAGASAARLTWATNGNDDAHVQFARPHQSLSHHNSLLGRCCMVLVGSKSCSHGFHSIRKVYGMRGMSICLASMTIQTVF